jgi:hypothetical protein
MKFFKVFSVFPKRAPSPLGVFSPSAKLPESTCAPSLLADLIYSALALTLFYFLSRPVFK